MKVSGILETALSVADPAASATFYKRLFGFDTLMDTDRLVALNVAGRHVLLLFKKEVTEEPATLPGGVIPGHGASGRSHLAFSITAADIEPWRERLAGENVAVESTVNWPAGATSLYFRDPDQHLVELITPDFWAIY
ncbi:MAG TPA: VOC family protein [Gemmataceae bacterium]|jgi:catechol 2,3-dioxygenase-like lactoylglutathione lyase family enzyme